MSPVLEKEGALYVFIRATRWSDLLNDIKKKKKQWPSLSYSKTLSIGPALRIEYCVRSAGLRCALRGTQGMRYWRKKKRIPFQL